MPIAPADCSSWVLCLRLLLNSPLAKPIACQQWCHSDAQLRLYHLLLPIWGTLEITGQASKFFSYSAGVANEHQIACYATGQPQPASMALAVVCMPTACLYAASHPVCTSSPSSVPLSSSLSIHYACGALCIFLFIYRTFLHFQKYLSFSSSKCAF